MRHNLLYTILVALAACSVGLGPDPAYATGITADVGLTPPADRWILRSQLRYMRREDPTPMNRKMSMHMVPIVLAYGVRPDLTAIIRQPVIRRRMEMPAGSVEDTGLGDFTMIAKYRLARINTPKYIFGIAPTLGFEFPTGSEGVGSDTWDILTGFFFSGRRGALGADLNLEYKINSLEDRDGDRPGDEFAATLAVAPQLSLNETSTISLWPVVELAFQHEARARADGHTDNNTGEDIVLFAPGLKYANQSFMLEFLVQFPIYQDQNGDQLERSPGGLLGFRYLF